MDSLKKNICKAFFVILGILLIYEDVFNRDPDGFKKLCVSFRYNARVTKIYSPNWSRDLFVEGTDSIGDFVKYEIPKDWELEPVLKAGDSIFKKEGEREIRVIKKDTVLLIPLIIYK